MKSYSFSGVILLLAVICCSLTTSAKPNTPPDQPTTFDKQWKAVDSLSNQGLPKSALEIVNRVFLNSKAEKNNPQFIKSIIYKAKLRSEFMEDALLTSIYEVRTEIRTADKPLQQLLNSVLAELYWKYYQQNRYRFRERTMVSGNRDDSIQTWDLTTLLTRITETYRLSLNNSDMLKKISIRDYEAILEKPVTEKDQPLAAMSMLLRPTLYDFLAWRALGFYMSSEKPEHVPGNTFQVTDPLFFAQSGDFIKMNLHKTAENTDTTSLEYYAISLFKDLAAFHFNTGEPAALIDEELNRLEFVHSEGVMEDKDSLYLSALKEFEKQYQFTPFSTDISFVIAQFLMEQGALYDPKISAKHKWDLKEAAGICEAACGKYPESNGSINCRVLLNRITRTQELTMTTEKAVIPGQPFLGKLDFKNIKVVNFRLYKTDPETFMEKTSSMNREDQVLYIERLPIASVWSLTLPNDSDYQGHSIEFPAPEVPSGFYVLLCTAEPTSGGPVPSAYTSIFSTHLSYISGTNEKGEMEIFLPDRETGKPLRAVSAEAFIKQYDYNSRRYITRKIGDYTSDEEGMISVPALSRNMGSRDFYMKLRMKNEFYITDNFFQSPRRIKDEKWSFQTVFFTDRAIYRPGQTIYYKGILLEKAGDIYLIKPGVKTTVVFTDVNGQKVDEQTFTVNDFGSFSGSFTAPIGKLTGSMTISNGSGSASVSVEEYKRPTFDVTFNPMTGNYRLNEKLSVTGKAVAYAGNSIDGATVNYRVIRNASFPLFYRWWGNYPTSPETMITKGSVKTNPDGSFNITFTAAPDKSVDPELKPEFDFSVYADVTDLNGETRSGETCVSVGYNSLIVASDMPHKLDLRTDSIFKVRAVNLNRVATPVKVTVTISRLHQPDRVLKPRHWDRPDLTLLSRDEFIKKFPNDVYGTDDQNEKMEPESVLFEKTLDLAIDSTFGLFQFARHLPDGNWKLLSGDLLKQGIYLLTLKATDPFGQPVEIKTFFTAFNPVSKEAAVNVMNCFVPLKTNCEPGDKAQFLFGSAEKNITALYEIRIQDSLVSRQFLKLSQEQTLVEIPVKKEYRGDLSVTFIFTKNNRVFRNTEMVNVTQASKKLDIIFSTFRNKLLPGQKEEWKIRILNDEKKGVTAEFLAGMYDASLDEFAANNWSFSLAGNYNYTHDWSVDDAFRIGSGGYFPSGSGDETLHFYQYNNLNWFGYGFSNYQMRGSRPGGMMMLDKSAPPTASLAEVEVKGDAVQKISKDQTVSASSVIKENSRPEMKAPVLQVRRDFRETAFFYPSLMTDSLGNISVSFTVPESLTKWKLLGFAHTRNLEYGQVEKSIITQKELMVFPNAPRFVRQGDTVVFSAKVTNLSNRTLSGDVQLELEDGITDKPLSLVTSHQSPELFNLKPNESGSVSWTLFIPADASLNLLKYRVIAKAGDFSDGEEKAIPVLTNRMLVTESLPLPVRGTGTFNFSLDKLLKTQGDPTLKNYKLTLEFTSNPAWYAIQALPVLADPKYPNADNLFEAFYANSIASFIANSSPKVKQVFDSWKALTPDALLSNLEKNEQLKSAVLAETPWVMEAKSESARKQRISLLFDLNTMGNRLDQTLQKLRDLQSANGGWPWFEGMQESRYITQNIVTGLGHLWHLGIRNIRDDNSTWIMVSGAIGYLDREMVNEYRDIKKYNATKMNENHLSGTAIQYLYARSYFLKEIPLDDGKNKEVTEAFSYFRQQAETYWKQNNLYFQGMIALALNRLGNKSVPSAVLLSISDKALHNPETGMYWANPSGYYWYESPIETQSLLIEAYDEVLADRKSVDEMKNWLLKQKQTQDWETGRATAEACYALLLKGMNLLVENPTVSIKVGNEVVDPAKLQETKAEAGTGYFQVNWDGKQIAPEMGKVEVTRSGEGIAWGALYWQYFEQLDKITTAKTPLKITKELYRERNTDKGPILEQIPNPSSIQHPASSITLKVGDKIKVRVILIVDRDLEYVHMKDMRASAFEPAGTPLSGYRYQDGLGYYQSTTDAATNFFFDYLRKGTYVFEYPLVVNASGNYSNGITTVQCMYAPEFSAHSEGVRVTVK